MGDKAARPRLQFAPLVSSGTVNEDGKTFDDAYALRDLVGKGSFSKVYMAQAGDGARTVAVKIVQKTDAVGQGLCAELAVLHQIREAPRASSHHYLLHFIDSFEDRYLALIVTEYYPNGELYALIERRTFLDAVTARRYLFQLCTATEWLHDHRIVHGDIKPENCMLDANMDLRLIDFGSVVRNDEPPQHSGIGSPLYLAPEVTATVAAEQPPYVPACDLWSIGVVLHVMLCGTFPPATSAQEKYFEELERGKELRELLSSLMHENSLLRGNLETIRRNAWVEWGRIARQCAE